MNDTEIQFYIVVLMGLSVMTGVCGTLLVQWALDYLRDKRREDYNPWGPGAVYYEEPMPHMLEQPISARKK